MSRSRVTVGLVVLMLVGSLGAVGVIGASAGSATDTAASTADPSDETDANVSEEEYVEPAPEPGELYYEASDGNWVSYINPRDEYRSPYLGDGSGKIGITLLNEAGDPIVGETVPNTTVTIPTGETTSWHSKADPVTVQLPLTDHYERPYDADQFGTTDDLPQGDGYMDAHTIEMHGHPEDATIEYGEVQIEGEHADKIKVVGYVQQAHDTWDTDIDPLEAAEPYEEAGGGWTYRTDASHGQVIVVLQLDGEVTGFDGATTDNSSDDTENNDTENNDSTIESETSEDDDSDTDEMPGLGVSSALVALTFAALAGIRRRPS